MPSTTSAWRAFGTLKLTANRFGFLSAAATTSDLESGRGMCPLNCKRYARVNAYSDYVHGMRGDPNVHLLEPLL